LIFNSLLKRPVINANKAKEITGLTLPSVYTLIEELQKIGILDEITGGKRSKLYLFKEYTSLLN